jgi:hypothetical protein
VLIPVVNRIDGLTLLLTERSANLPDHPGQISQGAREPGDVSLLTLPYEARGSGSWPSRLRSWANSPVTRRDRLPVTPFVGWAEPPSR